MTSSRETIRLRSIGSKFITGLSNAYEDDFPVELAKLVSEEDFEAAINQINNTLADYWPCTFCVVFGYGCCICTAGLSFICPNFCISDAEGYVLVLLNRINCRSCFQEQQIEWKLVKKCGQSWIEISFPTLHAAPTTPYQALLIDPEAPRSSTEGQYGSGY